MIKFLKIEYVGECIDFRLMPLNATFPKMSIAKHFVMPCTSYAEYVTNVIRVVHN